MAGTPITDPAEARALIEDAIAWQKRPALTVEQVDRLVSRAASMDALGGTQYTIADLNRAASLGWQWKAAAASEQFEAGVGTGKNFKLNQIYDHCMNQAAMYGAGHLSVTGSADASDGSVSRRGARIGSVGMTSVKTRDE